MSVYNSLRMELTQQRESIERRRISADKCTDVDLSSRSKGQSRTGWNRPAFTRCKRSQDVVSSDVSLSIKIDGGAV